MINFTPGPSQLYFTVSDHIKKALKEGVPSLSHRSKEFEKLYDSAVSGLHELLGLPADYFIVFTGSATEIWERSLQNLVSDRSLHFVNGAFSKRYFEIATQLDKRPSKIEAKAGEGFASASIDSSYELIALTHNETSTGVSLSLPFINSFKGKQSESLVIVDAVSSLPHVDLDFSKIDSAFFSIQKGFGLPAGLGVWMANERCLAKAKQLASKKGAIGSYHSLPSLYSFYTKRQTPETPNVLAIYLLGKVVEDLLRRGIHTIRKETTYKAVLLYKTLEDHPLIKPFVSNASDRSETVIVADCGNHTKALTEFLTVRGFAPGEGYGEFKERHLRFANFPAHSKEQYECLADALQSFEGH
ncbi:MAG: aminotransferase class V-fold PLP-dependent enzyme [Cyclobacteriaceae bacterium]|nr:aminotransferase class V-fold PLP-dependent enzyme [Cyclobacteriaceae bacterium]